MRPTNRGLFGQSIQWCRLSIFLTAGALSSAVPRAADVLPQLTQLLSTSDDPQWQLDVIRGINAAVQGRRSVPMPEGWAAAETKLATNSNAEVRTLAQTLSLTFGSTRARDDLRALAANPAIDAPARHTALASLLTVRDPELPALMQRLLEDSALRGAAVRGLATYDSATTPDAILSAYPKLNAAEKRDALNTLASRAPYAQALLNAVAAGKVPKTELTADLVRQLRNLKDDAIRNRITELWGVVNETSPDMQAAIDLSKRVYWAGGSQPGDASRGRLVYSRICAQCHVLFDNGGAVGPDITGANRSDLDYLLQNILFPNAVIPNEYRASVFEVNDGRVVMGVLKRADGTAYHVQTATEVVTLPRSEVAKVEQSAQSMMPEGLLTPLKEQEIRDLLYYLSRPGQVPLPAEAK